MPECSVLATDVDRVADAVLGNVRGSGRTVDLTIVAFAACAGRYGQRCSEMLADPVDFRHYVERNDRGMVAEPFTLAGEFPGREVPDVLP